MQVFCTCHALRGGRAPRGPDRPLGTWAVLRAQFAVRDPPSSPNPRCLPAPLPDRPRPVVMSSLSRPSRSPTPTRLRVHMRHQTCDRAVSAVEWERLFINGFATIARRAAPSKKGRRSGARAPLPNDPF